MLCTPDVCHAILLFHRPLLGVMAISHDRLLQRFWFRRHRWRVCTAAATPIPFLLQAGWTERIDLLIEAMGFVAAPCRLRIAGTGPDEQRLRSLAASDTRIEFLGRISDEDLVAEYASCRAVPFVPFEEDLGLITIEAQMASKAVVTCSDSGGSLDLVTDGSEGFVAEPNAVSIGRALNRLALDEELARMLGARGFHRASQLTWDSVVDGLIGDTRRRSPSHVLRRPKVVAFSTYPAFPARHGGQVRMSRLFEQLGRVADVEIFALGDDVGSSGRVSPGVEQIIVQASASLSELDARLSSCV
jgi:hypothetical protein